jgi:putative transposase
MPDRTSHIPDEQHDFDPIYARNIQRVFRARFKVNVPGYISHITQRAAGKEPLFLEDSDYLTMLGLLKESAERFNLCYYALCLMPNHVHMLLEPQERNLAEAMRSVFSRYAAKFNRKYERRGHLFGGPYRQSVCLDSTYLLTASVYIHLNPVRAGLVDDVNSYRWSSASLYCRDKPEDSFIDSSQVLQLVHDDESTARKQYRQILKRAQGEEPDNALEQEGAIEGFCLRLAEIFPRVFGKLGRKEEGEQNSSSLLELTELERRLQEVASTRARSEESKQAKKYIAEQLLARGFKKTEIASKMGVSRKAVYNILSSNFT